MSTIHSLSTKQCYQNVVSLAFKLKKKKKINLSFVQVLPKHHDLSFWSINYDRKGSSIHGSYMDLGFRVVHPLVVSSPFVPSRLLPKRWLDQTKQLLFLYTPLYFDSFFWREREREREVCILCDKSKTFVHSIDGLMLFHQSKQGIWKDDPTRRPSKLCQSCSRGRAPLKEVFITKLMKDRKSVV